VNRVLPPPRGTSSKAGEGLGRVSYVQPTAQVLVQLQCGDAAVDAASASSSQDGVDSSIAVSQSEGGALSAPPAETGSTVTTGSAGAAVTIKCTPVGGPVGSSSSSKGSGSSNGCGVYECVLEVDRLMPGLQQASVLLEVIGGGLSRSLPRCVRRDGPHACGGLIGKIGAYPWWCWSSGCLSERVPAAHVSLVVTSGHTRGIMPRPPG
jgi:hypothetical protein